MSIKDRILAYLERNPQSTGARMISDMKLPRGSISASLNNLHNRGMIVSRQGKIRGVYWSLAGTEADVGYPAWLCPGRPPVMRR